MLEEFLPGFLKKPADDAPRMHYPNTNSNDFKVLEETEKNTVVKEMQVGDLWPLLGFQTRELLKPEFFVDPNVGIDELQDRMKIVGFRKQGAWSKEDNIEFVRLPHPELSSTERFVVVSSNQYYAIALRFYIKKTKGIKSRLYFMNILEPVWQKTERIFQDVSSGILEIGSNRAYILAGNCLHSFCLGEPIPELVGWGTQEWTKVLDEVDPDNDFGPPMAAERQNFCINSRENIFEHFASNGDRIRKFYGPTGVTGMALSNFQLIVSDDRSCLHVASLFGDKVEPEFVTRNYHRDTKIFNTETIVRVPSTLVRNLCLQNFYLSFTLNNGSTIMEDLRRENPRNVYIPKQGFDAQMQVNDLMVGVKKTFNTTWAFKIFRFCSDLVHLSMDFESSSLILPYTLCGTFNQIHFFNKEGEGFLFRLKVEKQ